MNHEELKKMVNQIDDKYIKEAEPKKSSYMVGRKTVFFYGRTIVKIAAAVTIILVGGTLLDHWNVKTPTNNLETPITESAVEENETDPSRFFQATKTESVMLDYTLEVGGPTYQFDELKNVPVQLPGDGIYTKGGATLYCNDMDEVENAIISFRNEKEEKYVGITISKRGNFFSCSPIERKNEVTYRGTEVFGYEQTSQDNTKSLELYFTLDGAAYTIHSSGLSYEEMVEILDMILSDNIQPEKFDRSKASKKETTGRRLTISEVNQLETFEGKVPSITNIGNLSLAQDSGNNYFKELENDKIVSEQYNMSYYSANSYSYIDVSFMKQEDDVSENMIEQSQLTKDTVELYSHESDNDYNRIYEFGIDCGTYSIRIVANCKEESLWTYLENLQ